MKQSRWIKILAAILSVSMTAQTFPVQVFAQQAEPVQSEAEVSETEAKIIGEDTEKRSEDTKHFVLDDGTTVAAVYDIPVHYEDENGVWQDIDNRLEEAADPLPEAAKEENTAVPESVLKNKRGAQNVQFSNAAKKEKMVSVEVNGYPVSWGFEGINSSRVEVTEKKGEQIGNDRFLSLPNVTQEVYYRDIQTDVDLQYILSSVGVKENIILKKRTAQSSFIMQYRIGDLQAVQESGRRILLQDADKNTVYIIEAPAMTDASGASSNAVSVRILEQKNKQMRIELTADTEWLQEKERQYPVTIDPDFTTSQKSNTVSTTYLSSSNPTTSYGKGGTHYEGSIYVGYYAARGKVRSLIRLNMLPVLSDGDVIVAAQMHLLQRFSYSNVVVRASRATGSWDSATATWNNASNLKDSVNIDYHYSDFAEVMDLKTKSWDVTSLMKGWYDGSFVNNGIMLTADSENGTNDSYCWYYSSDYPDAEAARPVFTIVYRNSKGIEPYWTYTSAAAGRNGGAYINNYNGALTIVNTAASLNGNRLPVTIQNIYNHGQSAWRTNFNIQIKASPASVRSKYPYYLLDADGTEHYFYVKDGVYKDEDGLGYTLTIDAAKNYSVTDKQDGKMLFNDGGFLTGVQDTNGNRQTVAYEYVNNMHRITTVKDPSGRTFTYRYNATGQIASITDPAGRATTYTYGDGVHLTKITDPDGGATQITYSGNYPTRIQNLADGTKVEFAYDARKRTAAVASCGTNGEINTKYILSYKENHTIITDHTGRKYTYRFNNFGQTISVVDNQTNQASYYEFGAPSTGAGTEKANKVLSESNVQNAVTNYIKNPSFSFNTSSYQISIASMLNSTVFVTHGQTGRNGSKAVSINKPGVTDTHAFYIQYVTPPVGTYTYSAYVKIDEPLTGEGVRLAVHKYKGETAVAVTSACVTEKTNGWKRLEVTFTINEGEAAYVGPEMRPNTTGTILVDDMQLEKGSCANSFNLLSNNALLSGTADWTYGTAPSVVGITELPGSEKALEVASAAAGVKEVKQKVMVSGKKGDVFSFGGWGCSRAASSDVFTKNGKTPEFSVRLEFGTSAEKKTLKFDPYYRNWQFVSGRAIAPADYDYVTFVFVYNYNINTAWFTDGFLYKEEFGQTYTYDENGNVQSVVDASNKKSTFAYENNMLKKLCNPTGSEYTYNYDSRKNLTSASTSDGQTYAFTYDAYGNPLTAEMYKTGNASEKIKTSATYTAGGNYMSSLTDAFGNTTNYSYNETKGLLQSVTDAYRQRTDYIYNAQNDRMERVESGDTYVSYGYDKDRLSSILHNDGQVKYTFEYDVYGRTANVRVGNGTTNQRLSANTYNNRNLLSQFTYGNGDVVHYAYNNTDQLSEKWFDDSAQKVYYYYNSDGQLGLVRDQTQDTRSRYTYDLAGRLMEETVRQNSERDDGELVRSVSYQYEEGTNRLLSRTDNYLNIPFETGYVYGDKSQGQMADAVYGVTMNGVNQLTYAYDSLGRRRSRALRLGGNGSMVTEYTYIEGKNPGETSTMLHTMTQNGKTIQYFYDKNGNIDCIDNALEPGICYSYDSLNQLTEEFSLEGGRVRYTYDNGGNITSRDTNGVVDTWEYNDSNWKDLLTAYNGMPITYDEIGNPLTYRNGMNMTWENGRRLSSITGNGSNISYTYNADGIRTSKTVNGQTTEYVVDGSTILGEKLPSGGEIYYFFDENGVRYGFARGGNLYYYAYNGQGDVIEIYNSGGRLEAWYKYDSWGKVTEMGGNLAVAEMNPIRYRGYYYDTETGFYYLNSRYYDPETCRFINADGYVSTGQGLLSGNMFAYCLNNPVSNEDSSGSIPMRVKYSSDGIISTASTLEPKVGTSIRMHSNDYVNPKIPPNSKSGYKPPKKNKNPQKVKNPNGEGRGWPSKDGGVWIPDNNMDGGPGWVVQYPGGGHEHHYPDGKVRTHHESNTALINGLIGGAMIIGSGVAIIVVVVNDATGIGVFDDFSLPPLLAAFFKGVEYVG